MKLQLVSDLHLEFIATEKNMYAVDWKPVSEFLDALQSKADVLVIAGDTCPGELSIDKHKPGKNKNLLMNALYKLAKMYDHVIFVTGNHDYYHTFPDVVTENIKKAIRYHKNLHFLNNEPIKLTVRGTDSVKFYGGTMWFPEILDKKAHFAAKYGIPDFRCIGGFEPWVYEQNAEFVTNLRKFVDKDTIVVSHHMPTNKSVAPRWKGSVLNPVFVSDQEKDIADLKPKMWIHGHTHDPFDYFLDDTHIMCNPYGYRQFGETLGFDYNLIVEV